MSAPSRRAGLLLVAAALLALAALAVSAWRPRPEPAGAARDADPAADDVREMVAALEADVARLADTPWAADFRYRLARERRGYERAAAQADFDPLARRAALDRLARDVRTVRGGGTLFTPGARLLLAHADTPDGSDQPWHLALPGDYADGDDGNGGEPRRWPLVVFLHGQGMYAPLQSRPHPIPGWIVASPHGRGGMDYQWVAERDVLAVVDAAVARLRVDPGRIVLAGASMGGSGSWHLAARFPDRWAGLAPVCGITSVRPWWGPYGTATPADAPQRAIRDFLRDDTAALAYAENLLGLEIAAFHGANDPVNAFENAALMRERLAALGHPAARFVDYPRLRHGLDLDFGAALAEGAWTRDPAPARVRHTTAWLRYGRAHWVAIRALARYGAPARVDARVQYAAPPPAPQGGTDGARAPDAAATTSAPAVRVEATTDGVAALRLWPARWPAPPLPADTPPEAAPPRAAPAPSPFAGEAFVRAALAEGRATVVLDGQPMKAESLKNAAFLAVFASPATGAAGRPASAASAEIALDFHRVDGLWRPGTPPNDRDAYPLPPDALGRPSARADAGPSVPPRRHPAAARPGWRKNARVEGPVEHAFTDRFVLVAPDEPAAADGSPAAARRRAARAAEAACAAWWKKRFSVEPIRRTASTLTDADRRDAGLILFGADRDNPETARSAGHLPLALAYGAASASGRAVAPAAQPAVRLADGRAYAGENIGFIACHPRADAPDRYVVVYAGSTAAAYEDAVTRFGNWFDWVPYYHRAHYDYAVYDDRTTGRDPETFLAWGFFDADWRFADASHFEGDADWRARAVPRGHPAPGAWRRPAPALPDTPRAGLPAAPPRGAGPSVPAVPAGDGGRAPAWLDELLPLAADLPREQLERRRDFAGRPLAVAGRPFTRGVAFRYDGEATFATGGRTRFRAVAGAPAETRPHFGPPPPAPDPVVFTVAGRRADGSWRTLRRVESLPGADGADVDVDVAGYAAVRLRAQGGAPWWHGTFILGDARFE